MANDKDFTLTNGIEVGGSTKNSLGTISASNAVDLSTGNYFTHTPTGSTTYSFTNPGAVQSFQMQLTGGQEAVANAFSTTAYAGTGSNFTLTNGIDLAGDGGLVWTKQRNATKNHVLIDTVRGSNKYLKSNTEDVQDTGSTLVTGFNSNGYGVGTGGFANISGGTYVSWVFKKTPKFFDIVTYAGNGSARAISHNLGSVPGMIIIKGYDRSDGWAVYHRGHNGGTDPEDYVTFLSGSNAQSNSASHFNDTSPTSTHFTVGTESMVNSSSNNYVAYLFGHDTTADSMIQCGSVAYNSGATVNLGWSPQWVMTKDTAVGNWNIADAARGIGDDGSRGPTLYADSDAPETANGTTVLRTATGFTMPSGVFDASTHIYVAIRSAAATSITYPSSVKFQGGLAPQTPANGETDLLTFSTKDGGTSYTGVHSIDNAS